MITKKEENEGIIEILKDERVKEKSLSIQREIFIFAENIEKPKIEAIALKRQK